MKWKALSLVFPLCVICHLHVQAVFGAVRKYYVTAEDIEWDYTDTQLNLVNKDQQNYADVYLKQGNDRIGKRYLKTTYFQYTDDTFTTKIPTPEYLGILGPTIRGEIGDVIDILYMNKASGIYSMHPHGVFYLKQHEGAMYVDGTSGRYKYDEIVMPGDSVRLIWNVTDRDAPGVDDPNCIPWVYHSHVETVKDTSAGLIGALITCKKGILNDKNERTDVTLDIPILLKIFDENLSWHIDSNIMSHCMDPAACQKLKGEEDEDFTSSNHMHSLNGRMFGHLKGIEACVDDRVAFYALGMGNEFDVHSLYFQGQNLHFQHKRGDTVSVYTATFVTAETTPTRAGTWILSDMVDGMARAGMSAFYTTNNCNQTSSSKQCSKTEVVKEYFLSAEEVEWDYGPGGKDVYANKSLTDKTRLSAHFFQKTSSRIGGVYKKARYFQYTDNAYTTKVNRSTDEDYMGILGPVIEAEVGDTVKVTLRNAVSFPVSFLPHAFSFNYTEEIGNVAGSKKSLSGIVQPGTQHTYTFKVPDNMLDDGNEACFNYMYVSGVDSTRDHNTGLVGPILICRKGYTQKKDKPKSYFVFVTMFDENESMLLDENIRRHLFGTSGLRPNSPIDKSDEDFKESNIVFTINGFAHGTIPGLTVCLDSNVTWYSMALGSNRDVHSITFDGNNFNARGKNRNVQQLAAGTSAVLHMTPDNRGPWLIQSVTRGANQRGAYGLYNVMACGKSPKTQSYNKNREYYIAAEEVDWDYAPMERGVITGADLNDPREEGEIFVRDDEAFVGDVYIKSVFREYESCDFRRQKIRPVSEKHMDILGPAIRAEVNDKITIHFKNKASRPYSMHPHGVKYSHSDSGKTYGSGKADVVPGETRIYTWHVPPRSGPGPNDPDCIPWLYYSGLDQKDVLSGLIGPIIICRPGTLDNEGKRKDQHQEFYILMSIFDENKSWYLDQNVNKYAPNRIGTDYMSDGDFEESNKLHSINGRIFGNSPYLLLEYNRTVDWYFMVMGSKDDLHTIHTHGHTFLHTSEGHRDDVMSLFPGMAEAVQMKTDNPGTWLLHCHVLDHISAGMETTYTVLKPGVSIPKDATLTNTIIG